MMLQVLDTDDETVEPTVRTYGTCLKTLPLLSPKRSSTFPVESNLLHQLHNCCCCLSNSPGFTHDTFQSEEIPNSSNSLFIWCRYVHCSVPQWPSGICTSALFILIVFPFQCQCILLTGLCYILTFFRNARSGKDCPFHRLVTPSMWLCSDSHHSLSALSGSHILLV